MALSAAAGRLSRDQQRTFVAHEKDIARAIEQAVSTIASSRAPRKKLIEMRVRTPVEEDEGEPLGEMLSKKEGRERLEKYAVSMRLEDRPAPWPVQARSSDNSVRSARRCTTGKGEA